MLIILFESIRMVMIFFFQNIFYIGIFFLSNYDIICIYVRINVDDKKKTSIWKTNFNLYFYDAQEKLVNFYMKIFITRLWQLSRTKNL